MQILRQIYKLLGHLFKFFGPVAPILEHENIYDREVRK